MKKNIVKISLLSILSLGGMLSLNSCRDAIDIVQDGEVSSDVFFSSVENLQSFLQGDVYPHLENAQAIYITSLLTDEVKIGKNNGGQGTEVFRHFVTSSTSEVSNIWLQNYTLINRVAILLDGAKKITPDSSQVDEYNRILAEARTLRALAYLQLETYFSEDMANDNALGVILVDEVPRMVSKLPRSTNKEIFAFMESDLDFAEQYLPQTSRYYASKDLVYAIKARLNLYRNRHSEAKTYAQKVVSSPTGFSLTKALPVPSGIVGSREWYAEFSKDASISPYKQIWTDNSKGEVIFAAARPVSGGSYVNVASYYNTNRSNSSGSNSWEMGTNLYNILDNTAGDIRKYAYLDATSTSTNLVIDKYPGKTGSALRNDAKFFRLSEMYFILAEVAVAENNLVVAADYIHKVREARNYLGSVTMPVYADNKSALVDILKERRVELAYEGHRYIDLKRLAEKAGAQMDRYVNDDLVGKSLINLSNGNYKYTLPIPLQEITGNPNAQQNKGY